MTGQAKDARELAGRMLVISVVTQKGGSGKTTLAVHLAVEALANGFSSVALIDLDPQRSAVKWGRRRTNALPYVIPSQPENLQEHLSECRDAGVELVIIDTPPRRDIAVATAVTASDLCVVPVKPGVFDIEAAEPTVREIRSSGRRGCFALSEVPPVGREGEDTREVLRAQYRALPVLAAQLTRRKAFSEALIGGYGVREQDSSRGKARKEASTLLVEIAQELARVT